MLFVNQVIRPIRRHEAHRFGLQDSELHEDIDDVRGVAVVEPWYEVRLSPEWIAAYRLTLQGGAPVIAELRIFPEERDREAGSGVWSGQFLGTRAAVPPGGITATLLRSARVSEHHREGDAALREMSDFSRRIGSPPEGLSEDARTALATGSRVLAGLAPQRDPPRSRAPRQRLPMTYYAELAAEYVAALERGDRRPIQTIANGRGLTVHRTRDLIHRARVRGLLSDSERGLTGGALTSKARALLALVATTPTEGAKGKTPPATSTQKKGRASRSRRGQARHARSHGRAWPAPRLAKRRKR